MIEEQSANVVVVPVNARVDMFQQMWLVKNGVIGEDSQGVFTPVAVQCVDGNIQILILPNRIQIACSGQVSDAVNAVVNRMLKMLGAAGSSIEPLQGCGLNVRTVFAANDGKAPVYSIEDIYFKSAELFELAVEDRSLNFSLVEEMPDLKVTTKVESAKHIESGREGLAVDINLHRDCRASSEVVEFLNGNKALLDIMEKRLNSINSASFGEE